MQILTKCSRKDGSWGLKDNLSSWTDRKKMKRKECGGKQWAVGSLFRSQHLNIQLFNDGGKNAKSLSCFLDNLNLNDSLFASFSSKFTKIISITQSNEVYFRMWRLYIICFAGADLWAFKTKCITLSSALSEFCYTFQLFQSGDCPGLHSLPQELVMQNMASWFSWNEPYYRTPRRDPSEVVTETLMLELSCQLKEAERQQRERESEYRRLKTGVDYSWLASTPRCSFSITTGERLGLEELCSKVPPSCCGMVIFK